MVSIVAYSRQKMAVEDKRDFDNRIVDTIKVKTSERVNWNTLRNMQPIPRWSQEHPTEPGFFLDFIKPNHIRRLLWELEAEYTTIRGGQVEANPLVRPADITFQTSLVEQPTFFDRKRQPICNRAGEFITGVMERIPLVEYSIKKNLAADPAWLQTHLGVTNSDAIKIRGLLWPANTLLLTSVSAGPYTTENRSTFSEYTIGLTGDARTWTQEVWNTGTVELRQVDKLVRTPEGERYKRVWIQTPILEGDPPEQVQEPVPLTAEGLALQDYLEPRGAQSIKTGALISLKFDTQQQRNFAGVLPLV